MVDRISNSPSRIPVPVKAQTPRAINGGYTTVSELTPTSNRNTPAPPAPTTTRNENYNKSCHENGSGDNGHTINANPSLVPNTKKEKGFETFVMTGDMIIKTTSPPKSLKKFENVHSTKRSLSPTPHNIYHDHVDRAKVATPSKDVNAPSDVTPATKSTSEPAVLMSEPDGDRVDNSGTKDSKETLSSSSFKSSDSFSSSSVQSVTDRKTAESSSVEVLGCASDISPERTTSTEELLANENIEFYAEEDSSTASDTDTDKHSIVTSKSAEKISFIDSRAGHPLVRTSKSHENYLQGGGDITLVNIDIDDDSLAYSMDVLSHEQSASSLDRINSQDKLTGPDQRQITSRSLQNSPERKAEKSSERVFMPGFISLEEPRVLKSKTKDSKPKDDGMLIGKCVDYREFNLETNTSSEMLMDNKPSREITGGGCSGSSSQSSQLARSTLYSNFGADIGGETSRAAVEDSGLTADQCDGGLGSVDGVLLDQEYMDLDSLYTQPCMKEVDRPSASRLAKRLFFLDGFKKSDVSRHLSKKNEFSTLVAEEYLKYFSLGGDSLDVALRKFLRQFCLIGETQERERVLAHFSKQYLDCNSGSYNSEDACHTLSCAIMLLNTDLHSQNIGRKMTCSEFIENLAELNDGENFPKEVLKSVYQAIKNEPIEWAVDDDVDEPENTSVEERRPPVSIDDNSRRSVGSNPFLDIPDPSKATEYKKGYVMRKCCMEAERRRTPFGKRGWKMYFATLRDMVLYLHKDDHGFKKGNLVESANNTIRIHHALATKASNYTKKQHVLRLQTADWAEYLFQTSDSKELQMWMDTINFVAASLSAPPLPGGVGSQAKFQRPLMPSSFTKLNIKQQLSHHEDRVVDLERDLQEHRTYPPEKGTKARLLQDYAEKETFLEHELKRFKTYVYRLQSKMASFPELEPSLVETAIGEVDEHLQDGADSGVTVLSMKTNRSIQRSLSDRAGSEPALAYSYVPSQDPVSKLYNEETITTHL